MKAIQKGDKVAYSAKFLRSIGAIAGDLAHGRGTVVELKKYGGGLVIAEIDWENKRNDLPKNVNVYNLARVGTSAMNAM